MRPGYLPSEEQELLLKACLLEGREALDAFEAWRHSTKLAALDQGSNRMLPLLYRRLQEQGVDHPDGEKLRAFYVRALLQNKVVFQRVGEVLALLRRAGIEHMLLKGAALVGRGYYDAGSRPMGDFDILVREESLPAAAQILEGQEWRAEHRDFELGLPYGHAINFRQPNGSIFDLHRHVLPNENEWQMDADFWEHAVEITFEETRTKVLGPTDQLLHICVHGARWNPVPSFRWVADALMLLRRDGSKINWKRIVDFAENHPLSPALIDTLGYLDERFGADIPERVIGELLAIPVPEYILVQYQTRASGDRAVDNVATLWRRYVQEHGKTGFPGVLQNFPRYLKNAWNKQNLFQVYVHLLSWPFRKFSKSLKSWFWSLSFVRPLFARLRAAGLIADKSIE